MMTMCERKNFNNNISRSVKKEHEGAQNRPQQQRKTHQRSDGQVNKPVERNEKEKQL
jgi:hypothetical protein